MEKSRANKRNLFKRRGRRKGKMCLLRKPCVITVSGPEDTRKSTTLIKLINHYYSNQKCPVYLYEEKTGAFASKPISSKLALPPPDYLVYLILPNGMKCGVSTGGDDAKHVNDALKKLKRENCDFYITATRTGLSQSFMRAEDFANNNGYEFLPIVKSRSNHNSSVNLYLLLFSLIK